MNTEHHIFYQFQMLEAAKHLPAVKRVSASFYILGLDILQAKIEEKDFSLKM